MYISWQSTWRGNCKGSELRAVLLCLEEQRGSQGAESMRGKVEEMKQNASGELDYADTQISYV